MSELIVEISLSPEKVNSNFEIINCLRKKLSLTKQDRINFIKIKQSLDARGKEPVFRLKLNVYVNSELPEQKLISKTFSIVKQKKPVHIIGAGPAGYFAALKLIENGFKPVIFDRGKDVRLRRRDLRNIQQFSIVNPDSNYCFGEGGAGTYSDGKLYTRSDKRGEIKYVLKLLNEFGAESEILFDAHPHIGSNKLPKIVANIRDKIIECGGEIFFNSKLTDLNIENNIIKKIVINDKEEIKIENLILATGHSARDIYHLCVNKKIKIEHKPFALGVRVEHPQSLIDASQYKKSPRPDNLPASSYKLVSHSSSRAVFSFCMCPGGLIVPAATNPEEIVVNGMSMSRRDSFFANSGIVVQINPEDLNKNLFTEISNLYKKNNLEYENPEIPSEITGLKFQNALEKLFFKAGKNNSQSAPAQNLSALLYNNKKIKLNNSSYIPGIYEYDFKLLLPSFIYESLIYAFKDFGKKIKGFDSEEGQIIGIESRTSSPVKIPRDKNSFRHIEINNLFPCGEGAGYAGGIVSAAIDGINVADAINN